MTPDQVFKYFDGLRATARALDLAAPSVQNWSKRKEVPFLRQCQLHLYSRGELRMSRAAMKALGIKKQMAK